MEIFPHIRMEGADFAVSELAGPWAFRSGIGPFHFLYVVRAGSCWLEFDGAGPPIELRTGDVAGVGGGHPHRLRDSLATPVPPSAPSLPMRRSGQPRRSFPGSTTLFVGRAPSDADPLGRLFPAIVHLPADGSESNRRVRRLAEMIEGESRLGGGPGSSAILARLSEVIAIEILRAPSPGGANPAWTRGLADPLVARIVTSLCDEPGRRWNIEEMRRLVGLSRSAFEHRFHALVGEPPKRYLLRVRIRRAITALGEGRESLAQIACRLGYESETAFHRAFKRATGLTPGRYRRRLLAGTGARDALEPFAGMEPAAGVPHA